MNTQILKQYSIAFQIDRYTDGSKVAMVVSIDKTNPLSDYIALFFIERCVEGFQENALETIQRAQDDLPFDPNNDGAGPMAFLTIGKNTSYLDRIYHNPQPLPIPTEDIKQIILSWIEWITVNNLENNTL